MRRAVAAVVLALAATAGGAAWAILRSHDAPPGAIAQCARREGASTVKGTEGLQIARGDVLSGRLRVARRYALGDDTGVLLRPAGGGYAILVVRAPGNPPTGRDLAERVFRDPSPWALVAIERDPVRGALDRCARASAG